MSLRRKTVAALLLGACAGPALAGGEVAIPFELADFDQPLVIDNPFWPLEPGLHVVYAEVGDDECITNDFMVTQEVKSDFGGIYAGLRARVIADTEWLDKDCDGGRDVLLEDTFDWYAQDDAGNVWYLGEDTTEFLYDEEGNPIGTSTEGSWQAGVDGAEAGLIMLAAPTPGAFYRQEFYADVAEDAAKIVGMGRPVSTALADYAGCLVTKEWTPLAPGAIEHKHYCPGAGLVLIEKRGGGPPAFVEAVRIDTP